MKRLIIARHGKAEIHRTGLSDFKRNLAKRGQQETPFIANKIMKMGIFPDLMISSPANRAIQTCKLYAKVFNYPEAEIVEKDYIYGFFSTDKLIYTIEEIKYQANTVIVFGHNPTLEELAYSFSGNFDDFIPTSGAVGIEFDVDHWHHITERSGNLIFFEFPKKYPENL